MKDQNITMYLIEGCRIGARQCQKTVYKLYCKKMFSLCLKYSNDLAEAERIMINGFSKAFSEIGSYKGFGSFEGWIRNALMNEALIHHQSDLQKKALIDFNNNNRKSIDKGRYGDRINQTKSPYLEMRCHCSQNTFNRLVLERYSAKEISLLMDISLAFSRINVRIEKRLHARISKLALRISYPAAVA